MNRINLITESILIEEGIIDNVKEHISDNRGKYAAGGTAALAGTMMAGRGYFGVGPQDAVNDVGRRVSFALDTSGYGDKAEGLTKSTQAVGSRPDNIVDGAIDIANDNLDNGNLKDTWDYEKYTKLGTYTGALKNGASSVVKGITGLDDKANTDYIIRNPGEALDQNINRISTVAGRVKDTVFGNNE